MLRDGLSNKTILVLSPQSWGKMFLSKHHYALELARRGNKVFFLNPPFQESWNREAIIDIKPSGAHENLFLVNHQLFFPYWLKFKLPTVFHWLIHFHIKKLLIKIAQPVDIVWSFDIGNLYPLKFFGTKIYKIFHPVDEPLNRPAIEAAGSADIIFSVTREILSKYGDYDVPKHFINHGVSDEFLKKNGTKGYLSEHVNVGCSGNFLRPEIDRETLLRIVRENPYVTFNFWGSYNLDQTNIGGVVDDETKAFIGLLKRQKNVFLHGPIPSAELASAMQDVDAFLICYDIEKDQSKGTNYHKVMEYISTGKITISNNITTYKDEPELVQMTSDRTSNNSLPALFAHVVGNLKEYNNADLQKKRRNFAAENSYKRQIDRIEKFLVTPRKNNNPLQPK